MRLHAWSSPVLIPALLLALFALAGCSPPAPSTSPAIPTDAAAAAASPAALPATLVPQPAGAAGTLMATPAEVPVTTEAQARAGSTVVVTAAPLMPPEVTLSVDADPVPWSGISTLRAHARSSQGVTRLRLSLGGQQLGEAQGADIVLEFKPDEVPGLAAGRTYTVTAEAVDTAGRSGRATLAFAIQAARASTAVPTSLPAPAGLSPAAPSPVPALAQPSTYRVESVVIPTYPYTPYLRSTVDPQNGDYPVLLLDRTAYEAANPRPVPVSYTLVVLENRYLRLGILPDLGGRIYECVFKPTGHEEFYRNPVIKPTGWGPGGPDRPAGANWWLAAGGLEWGFPVEEHGYEWGTRWGYDHAGGDDGSESVTVFTGDYRRPYAAVTITLPPDSAAFTVEPLIVNPTGGPFRFKWWDNAALAPGAANRVGPDLRFIIPGDQVTVHSAGDPALPAPGGPMSWPLYAGRDYSRLGDWTSWLGFFARPAASAGFAAVYDAAADEGVVRAFPPRVARGVKGFGMGWSQPIDPATYTDDGSSYVELHGGLAPTFGDWSELPPGGQVTWTETWYPAAGVGGVVYAAEAGAINVRRTSEATEVAVFPARPVTGRLTVNLPGQPPIVREVQIAPDKPFREQMPGATREGPVEVTLSDAAARTLLAYTGTVQ